MQYDIGIIGGGPAGIAAAITAASKGRKVVLFEAHGFSPRLRSVAKVSDYMGIPDISGNELMDIFLSSAPDRCGSCGSKNHFPARGWRRLCAWNSSW